MSDFNMSTDTHFIKEWVHYGAVPVDGLVTQLRQALAYYAPPPPTWAAATPTVAAEALPTEEEIIDWLDSLNYSLWSDHIITERAGQKRAAEWFVVQSPRVAEYTRQQRAK